VKRDHSYNKITKGSTM